MRMIVVGVFASVDILPHLHQIYADSREVRMIGNGGTTIVQG